MNDVFENTTNTDGTVKQSSSWRLSPALSSVRGLLYKPEMTAALFDRYVQLYEQSVLVGNRKRFRDGAALIREELVARKTTATQFKQGGLFE